MKAGTGIALGCLVGIMSGCDQSMKRGLVSATEGTPPVVADTTEMDRVGPNRFRLQIRNFSSIAASQPEDSRYCWAACAQMVLAATGQRATQSDLVKYFKGDASDPSANELTIMRAINPEIEDSFRQAHGRDKGNLLEDVSIGKDALFVGLTRNTVCDNHIAESIAAGVPVILGIEVAETSRHACVIVGVDVGQQAIPERSVMSSILGKLVTTENRGTAEAQKLDELRKQPEGGYEVLMFYIFDPEPGKGMREMPVAEFAQVSRAVITKEYARNVILENIRRANEAQSNPGKPLFKFK